jgi:hypothetical protein
MGEAASVFQAKYAPAQRALERQEVNAIAALFRAYTAVHFLCDYVTKC